LGILNLNNDELSIYFGQSAETSDFIVDCIDWWWEENKANNQDIEEWVLNVDGGSATRSNRTQFIKRMVELAKKIALPIRLIYYPPYHSKYNAIERCWAALEQYWNGAILNSVEAAVQWASHMRWKSMAPVVYLVEGIYEKGVKVLAEELEFFLECWQRSETLPQWDITIVPF
jgi:Rhodopirellula transposase DDE domain